MRYFFVGYKIEYIKGKNEIGVFGNIRYSGYKPLTKTEINEQLRNLYNDIYITKIVIISFSEIQKDCFNSLNS